MVAVIEVHRQLVSRPYDSKFNYDLTSAERKKLNVQGKSHVLSGRHQIIRNIMNTQMNDKAFWKRLQNRSWHGKHIESYKRILNV